MGQKPDVNDTIVKGNMLTPDRDTNRPTEATSSSGEDKRDPGFDRNPNIKDKSFNAPAESSDKQSPVE